MGHWTHRAIVVTGWEHGIAEAHAKAIEIFGELRGLVTPLSPPVGETCNGIQSFAVVPSGSKNGRDTEQETTAKREALKAWLGDRFDWVEATFGGDFHTSGECSTKGDF